jgi:hypothetical protein
MPNNKITSFLEQIVTICLSRPFDSDEEVFSMPKNMAIRRTEDELRRTGTGILRTTYYNIHIQSNKEPVSILRIEPNPYLPDNQEFQQKFQDFIQYLNQELEKANIPYS